MTEATKLPLYTNFRSGARILEAADVLIGQLPAQQRPDPDKRLVPWEENGPGEVHVARISDEVKEAAWVADRIVALHEAGAAWSDCAVLCRTSRLFLSLQQAFNERGVPAEILGLAGLLKMPEVVEVLAYARATLDPLASVALGRILLGPRYRVGFKDLALVASLAKNKSYALREEDEAEGEATPFLFTEALEHLDEVEGISEEGRARLEECRQELAALRVEARRPVGEFLGEIIRRTGILTELDAHLDVASAATARRNLAAFLDEVHAFSPVQGELTLRAFLEYVDAVENLDKQEWSPVQPSEEDSVKVMTIHVAKGLEFDHVFVPGLANGLLPNTTIQHNPAERGKSMDFELRGDASYLPRYDGNLSAFKKDLKKQEEYEERRTAYVAMTRARRTLHVTGAHWYAENLRAKEAGPFLRELKDWVMETKHATWDPGADIDEENNPILGYRERFVRDWPGPALPAGSDAVFPEGWRHAAVVASDDGGVQESLLESLDEKQREALVRLTGDRRGLALHLKEREEAEGAGAEVAPPQSVSVGGVIDYARCPKRFYWTSVRPLPRFSGPAARIGTEIHSWIERRSSGQGQLLELDDAPDLTSEELADSAGQGRSAATGVPRQPVRGEGTAVRRASVPPADGGVRGVGTDRRGVRRVGRGPMGDRRLEDREAPGRRRPARGTPARALRPRVHRGLGQARRGPHAHLSVPGGRRGGLASDGRSGRGEGPCLGVAAIDRRGSVRPHPRRVVPPLRLPVVLRGRPRLDRLGRSEPLSPRDETRAVRSAPRTGGSSRPGRSRPTLTPGTDRATRPVSAGTRTCATARNHSRSPGLQDRFPSRPGVAERGIVHHDGDRAERPFDRGLELRHRRPRRPPGHPSHVAEATAGGGGGGGGGGPGCGGGGGASTGSGG